MGNDTLTSKTIATPGARVIGEASATSEASRPRELLTKKPVYGKFRNILEEQQHAAKIAVIWLKNSRASGRIDITEYVIKPEAYEALWNEAFMAGYVARRNEETEP